jgi:hypothetical protein
MSPKKLVLLKSALFIAIGAVVGLSLLRHTALTRILIMITGGY